MCEYEIGIVSVGENSRLNVFLRKKLGQAVSEPNSPITGRPRLQPVATQSMHRDDTRLKSQISAVYQVRYVAALGIILTLHVVKRL